jgi:hypothetical protein
VIPNLLTPTELHALDLTAQLADTLSRIVGDGPTRAADLNELGAKIHDLQSAVMAQAAARAYPHKVRLLGDVVRPAPDVPAEDDEDDPGPLPYEDERDDHDDLGRLV